MNIFKSKLIVSHYYYQIPTVENLFLFLLMCYSGVSFELAACLWAFFITSYLIMSHSSENLFQLSTAASISPSAINPMNPHENRSNNDKDSAPNENKMPNPSALISLQSAGKNISTTREESIQKYSNSSLNKEYIRYEKKM